MTSEQRSCLSKTRHSSQRKACCALSYLRRKYKIAPGDLQIYFCRFCKGWHVGHPKINRQPMRYMERPK
jgi:hypothetical protein